MKRLDGAGVIVTRPEGRGEALCERIRALGGEALFFPTIHIAPLPPPGLPASAPDWMVFVSAAAIEHAPRALREIAANARLATVGEGTARALRSAGLAVEIVPDRQESEGLLDAPAFREMRGRRVWIVRGRGGRELLADTLRKRGAEVQFIEVYERQVPEASVTPLMDWWRAGRVDAIVTGSAAGLANLYEMLDEEGRRFLRNSQLVVPTARMLKLAHEFDIRPPPVVAATASDDALLDALAGWWHSRRQGSR
ncbi:MAG TPA: uroporphyrinogen-III synthase [Gammaproteobacteria bacterium]|nr:uroporphyrinogen-III synthase [Gammaproteobacteria bacterium]